VRDETEDTIMPAAASNDADTLRAAAARSGLQPQAKRKKKNDSRGKAFRVEHLGTFGLTVAQRESKTGKIASVASLFCLNFDREPRAGASEAAAAGKKSKYKTKTIVNQYSQPWRMDAFTQHLKLAHKENWSEYAEPLWKPLRSVLSLMGAQARLTRTPSTRIWTTALLMFFWISENIVVKVLGEMLFDPLGSKEKSRVGPINLCGRLRLTNWRWRA
jgi:hypothetical protein